MDKWSVYKKCDDFRVAAPKSVLDLVEIKSIAENGIFEIGRGGVFTKMYKFSDANYTTASVDEKKEIVKKWGDWLNSNSMPFKIIFNNKNKSMEQVRQEVLLKWKNDGYDAYREYYNEEIEDIIQNGRQGIEQEMYIVLRYDLSPEYENAKNYFNSKERTMINEFKVIGSELIPLNATERLKSLHDFYRFGNEEYFDFDFRQAVENGFDFKDAIVNSKMDFSYEDYFVMDKKYCSAIYLKQYPSKLVDEFMVSLTQLPVRMICTIDSVPISDADVDMELKSIYIGVEERIRKQNQTRVKQMDFASDISLSTKMDKEAIEDMIKNKSANNQHFFYCMINIVIIADSLEQLKKDVELVKLHSRNKSYIFDYSYMKQREAMNTVLPVGSRQVSNGRTMQTNDLRLLFPFNIQELNTPGGMWYGKNIVSKNICTANRKRLVNPHAFFFGETGSGKTIACKLELMQVFLDTDDDIIVIDPKNDYEDICCWLQGAYTNISTTSPDRYNPLEFYNNGKRVDIASEKASLVLSIVETIKRESLTAKETSIVNTALRLVYNNANLLGVVPTLSDLYVAIGGINEPEATELQWCLDSFINGSFNIFAGQSTVSTTGNRLVMFGLKDMGRKLRDVTMLIMLECVKERILKNAEIGRATWLYIDEVHEVLHTEYSQEFIKSLWMLVRSLGGICTAMTQNVSDVLLNYTTRAMLENSEFVIVLKQQNGAKETLINELGLSPELVNYVTDEAGFGRGLIRSGSVIIPFSLELNKNLNLLRMFDKNFHY